MVYILLHQITEINVSQWRRRACFLPTNFPEEPKIEIEERDMWMSCMAEALRKQGYSDGLMKYLIVQLSIPAERIRLASKAHRS